ncbi:hypothetical protein ASE61_23790 [Bosea sp. Root670]|nr:hypothetical protein ASE61_23790 [Bosea sp. Root670]
MLQFAGDQLSLFFGSTPCCYVDMRTDELDRLAQFVALDFSLGKDPTNFAVGRSDDPVFRLVLRVGAKDASMKLTDDAIPVFRMDARNPSLMSFVCGFRR